MKPHFLLVFLSFFFLFQSCQKDNSNSFSKKNKSQEFYLGGVHINEPDLQKWVNTVRDVGMNTVEVTAYAKQWFWNTSDLEFDGVFDQVNEIKLAEKAGLKTVFISRVQLQHWFEENHFKWHGMIMPASDSLIVEWFDKYIEFNLLWAKFCEAEGVDVMVIGSEMNALASTVSISKLPELYEYYDDKTRQIRHENRIFKYQKELEERHLWVKGKENYKSVRQYLKDKIEAHHNWCEQVTFKNSSSRIEKMNARRKLIKNHWLRLIREIRKIYSGKLTYAANFDNYQDVDFWNELDFIGINAYFPLRKPAKKIPESVEMFAEFQESWQTIFDTLHQFQQTQNLEDKPIFFTELGYTRNANSTLESWAGQGFSVVGESENEQLIIWEDQPDYPFERYLAVKALRQVSQNHPVHLSGILYWKLTTERFLLREEPFALHIYPWNKRGVQKVLVQFIAE